MRLAVPDWWALAVFAATVLAVTLYGLTVAGHFPAAGRRPALRGAAGSAVLWASVTVAVAAAVAAVLVGWTRLPGYAAVIAGGLAVLVAPLCLQPLPDHFVDGRLGLVTFAALAAALALLALGM